MACSIYTDIFACNNIIISPDPLKFVLITFPNEYSLKIDEDVYH